MTDTKQLPKQIEEYWQDKAIVNENDYISLTRGIGGSYYKVTGMKPYLPKEGRMTVGGWTFICKLWESDYCGKRAYIGWWKQGKHNTVKVYIAKEFNFYDNAMHYTYRLFGTEQNSEEFSMALKTFLEEVWTK